MYKVGTPAPTFVPNAFTLPSKERWPCLEGCGGPGVVSKDRAAWDIQARVLEVSDTRRLRDDPVAPGVAVLPWAVTLQFLDPCAHSELSEHRV